MSKQIKESLKDGGTNLHLENIKITKDLYKQIQKKLPDLTCLKINNCNLDSLKDDQLFLLTNLELLDISDNQLTEIPTQITHLSRLQFLSIRNNEFKVFPEIFWKMSLTRLSVSLNNIETLRKKGSDNALGMTLEYCDFSDNKLGKSANEELQFDFKRIQQIILARNQFTSIPKSLCKVSSLTSLNISENILTEIPDDFFFLNQLVELLVHKNKLTTISPLIGSLTHLKTLSFADNDLLKLPEEVGNLHNLQHLSIQHNKISELPLSFGKLTSLVRINIEHNLLTKLPDSISNLIFVSEFNADYNNLESLPSGINGMTSLNKLFLTGNKLTVLPDMGNLQKLFQLNLMRNHFKDPESIFKLNGLKSLQRLTLEENSFEPSIQDFIKNFGALALVQQGIFIYVPSLTPESDTQKRVRSGTATQEEMRRLSRRGSSELKPEKTRSWSLRLSLSKNPSVSYVPSHLTPKKRPQSSEVSHPDRHTEKKLDVKFEDFKEQFENLLKELELPDEKKEQMMKMPDDAKYKLLMQYQTNSNLTQSSSTPDSQTSPKMKKKHDLEYYINMLKNPEKITADEVSSLRIEMSSQSRVWFGQFSLEHGVNLLLSLLENITSRLHKNKSSSSLSGVLYECLRCIKVIAKLRIQLLLSISEPNPCIIVIANLDHPSDQESWTLVCCFDSNFDNQRPVLAALDYFKSLTKAPDRFSSLMNIFKIEIKQPSSVGTNLDELEEKLSVVPLKTVTLSIINNLIQNTDSLEERFHLRNELLNLGIQKYLSELSLINDEAVKEEIDTFQEGMNEDREELPTLGPTGMLRLESEGTTRVSHHRASNATSLFNLTANTTGENVLIVFNYSTVSDHLTTRVAYGNDSTVLDILKRLLNEFKIIDDPESYGLLVESTLWLEPDRTVSSYFLETETACELKPKPWKLKVKFGDSLSDFEISPTADCAQLLSRLSGIFLGGISESKEVDDFGLYFSGSEEFWLEETEKVSKYSLNKKQGILELKPRQQDIRINLVEGISKTISCDPNAEIGYIMRQLAKQINMPESKLRYYGLVAVASEAWEQSSSTDHWLEEKKKLSDYKLTSLGSLWFVVKPRKIRIQYEDEFKEILFDFSRIVSDLVTEISGSFKNNIPTNYVVFFSDSITKAENGHSLRDQNIPTVDTPLLIIRKLNVETLDSPEQDTNLYEEPNSEEFITLDEKTKKINTGTLNKLIEYITSDSEEATTAAEILFLTYPSFTSHFALIKKLAERYHVPAKCESDRPIIQTRVCEAFEIWKSINRSKRINRYLNEVEINTEATGIKTLNREKMSFLLKKIKKQEERLLYSQLSPTLRKAYSEKHAKVPTEKDDEQNSQRSLIADELAKEIKNFAQSPKKPEPKKRSITQTISTITGSLGRNSNTDRLTYFNIYSQEIAEQLTRSAHSAYSQIQENELMKQSWSKQKTQYLCPNIMEMINQFNTVANWVSGCIVSESKVRDRSVIVTNFIRIAQHLKKMNNFHILTAFISGMNSSCITRLKWTQKKIPARNRETFNQMEQFMSMEGSFKSYRAALSQVKGPCIPYIGLVLQDLTFIDENPEKIGERINFGKQRMVYNVIKDCLRFQSVEYDLQVSEDTARFLNSLPNIPEKDQYQMSLKIEPRNATRADVK